MASRLKITMVSLSAAFAAAVTPPAAFVAESLYETHKARENARQVADEMLAAVGLNDHPDAFELLAGYHACLDQFSLPAQGKALTLYNWSGRLTALPSLSRKMLAAADEEAQYSLLANASCVQETMKKILIPELRTLPPGGKPLPPGKGAKSYMT